MRKDNLAIIIIITLIIIISSIGFIIPEDKYGAIKVGDDVIKIGAILPMTGPNSIWGINEEKGINLALDELSDEDIKNVSVTIEDSKSNNNEAVTAAQKLINIDNVDIVYTSLTGVSNVVAPITSQSNKLHLYKAATIKPVQNFPNNSIKTGYYNYKRDCSILGDYAVKNNYRKVAYIYAQADFSTECKDSIVSSIGNNIVLEEYSFEASKEDFSTILAKIKNNDYDAIIATGYNIDFSKLYKKMSELEVKTPVLCAGGEDCLDRLEDVAPIGTIYFGMNIDKKFKDKLLEKYPNLTLLEQSIATTSYDMVNFVSEAYSKCPNKERVCLKKAIINSNLTTAQQSEGFDGSIIKLKVTLFQLSPERKIEALK